MRILWVKAGKLLPVDTGGKIRSYNLLKQLAARHALVLLTYYSGRRDSEYESEICRHFPGALAVNHTSRATALGQGLDYLFNIPSSAPYAVTKFTASIVQELLADMLSEGGFDVAVCDFLSASLNFPRIPATPVVLFQHNVESALWRRQARHEPNLIKRIAFKLESAKMDSYERAAVARFDHVIAVSENDREQMSGMTDPARITVVPTGVDLEQYRAASGEPVTEPLVIFLGSMDWEANIDGVEYFCREIWPQVLASVPNARFRIVGRDPHQRVNRLASDSVEVTGTVPSVIEHLKKAAVFVVPLRIGGGTRLKIYEAMAMGKATVSTTVGAEGLDVTHGKDILLADTAAGFAKDVITLLSDRQARRRFEIAAAELAARYDWSVIVELFEEVLRRASCLPRKEGAATRMAASVNI